LIDCLEERNIDVCTEAAHILSSLSYANPSSFITLLRLNAPRAFLFSINNFTPTTPPSLRTAFTRALRSITISIADIVEPSLWGLNPEYSIPIREEAKEALEHLLQPDSLDVWLPLLEEGGTAVPMMLANVLRSGEYRRVVAEWVPLEMRQKEVKTRRGWEKMGVGGPFGRQGGWVARGLVALLSGRDAKVRLPGGFFFLMVNIMYRCKKRRYRRSLRWPKKIQSSPLRFASLRMIKIVRCVFFLYFFLSTRKTNSITPLQHNHSNPLSPRRRPTRRLSLVCPPLFSLPPCLITPTAQHTSPAPDSPHPHLTTAQSASSSPPSSVSYPHNQPIRPLIKPKRLLYSTFLRRTTESCVSWRIRGGVWCFWEGCSRSW
jgi:hypothetical protein